jgi:hypothetical protein
MTRPTHIWVFDDCRREYTTPTPEERKAGKVWGHIIWKSHWVKLEVEGETSRSWLTSRGHKVPKKGANPRQYLFSELEVDQAAWKHDHNHKIVQKLERCVGVPAEQLDAIAAIIGYEVRMPR